MYANSSRKQKAQQKTQGGGDRVYNYNRKYSFLSPLLSFLLVWMLTMLSRRSMLRVVLPELLDATWRVVSRRRKLWKMENGGTETNVYTLPFFIAMPNKMFN